MAIAIAMRRLYRINMSVSGQARSSEIAVEKGPRARMKRIMLDTAMQLMQQGLVPSVTDVAEAAAVSRATAYRYFPSQAALIEATVGEALGPILEWTSGSQDAEERLTELLAFALPRIEAYEATHRAALLLALDQWRRRQAGTLGAEERFVRGHRKALLADALKPLRRQLGKPAFERAMQALSLIFGTEALVVLKDIWGLESAEAKRVMMWAAHALVRAVAADATAVARIAPSRAAKKDAGRKASRSKR
jgi:AcrR family transcriptional regulator